MSNKELKVLDTIEIPENGILLQGIDVTDDSISLMLKTPQGPIIGVCDADCCSETWIEHIELPPLGFPCKIFAAFNLQMPDERPSRDNEPQEFIVFYGLKLITDRGEIIIEYRNASNGYYGGSLVWDSKHFYSGVFGQQEPRGNWISVEEWYKRKNNNVERIEDHSENTQNGKDR